MRPARLHARHRLGRSSAAKTISRRPSAVCGLLSERDVRARRVHWRPGRGDAAARSVSGQITWPSDRRALCRKEDDPRFTNTWTDSSYGLVRRMRWAHQRRVSSDSTSLGRGYSVITKRLNEYLVLGSVTSTFRSNDHEQSQSACVTLSRIRSVNQPLGLLG